MKKGNSLEVPSFGTPSGVRTTWGGVRTLENRRFDALPVLTYPGNYPNIKQQNYDINNTRVLKWLILTHACVKMHIGRKKR